MWYADSLSAEVHRIWQATSQLPQAGSLRTMWYADRLSAEVAGTARAEAAQEVPPRQGYPRFSTVEELWWGITLTNSPCSFTCSISAR